MRTCSPSGTAKVTHIFHFTVFSLRFQGQSSVSLSGTAVSRQVYSFPPHPQPSPPAGVFPASCPADEFSRSSRSAPKRGFRSKPSSHSLETSGNLSLAPGIPRSRNPPRVESGKGRVWTQPLASGWKIPRVRGLVVGAHGALRARWDSKQGSKRRRSLAAGPLRRRLQPCALDLVEEVRGGGRNVASGCPAIPPPEDPARGGGSGALAWLHQRVTCSRP